MAVRRYPSYRHQMQTVLMQKVQVSKHFDKKKLMFQFPTNVLLKKSVHY